MACLCFSSSGETIEDILRIVERLFRTGESVYYKSECELSKLVSVFTLPCEQ